MKLKEWYRALRRRRRLLDRLDEFKTIVGSATEYGGEIESADDCIVHGYVWGTANCTATFMVGERGRFEGDITATNVIVAGEVKGTLTASERLVVLATAHIRGHLVAPMVAIAKGAEFDGVVRMKRAKVTRYEERRESRNAG